MSQPNNIFVGSRYVQKFYDDGVGGCEHNQNIAYEALTNVTYQGNTYTSKLSVPGGIPITNTAYWVKTYDYNAQVEIYEQNVRDNQQYVIDQMSQVNTDNNTFKTAQQTNYTTFTDTMNTNFNSFQNTTNSKLLDFAVNVKSYGAIGNGTTDDTVAIQAAINYAETTLINYNGSDMNQNKGYKLIFPTGNYKITSSLTFKAPVKVEGVGGNGSIVIFCDTASPCDYIVLSDTTQSCRFNIENIRLKYIPNGKTGILANGFILDGMISRCWFDGWGSTTATAIKGQFSNFLIEGNVFENLKNCFEGDTHHGDNRIVNNLFYKCLGSAIILNGVDSPNDWQTKHTIIANNNFNFPSSAGVPMIYLQKYHKCVVSNNMLNSDSNNLVDKFLMGDYIHDCIISANVIEGIVLAGIQLNYSYKNIISNNIVQKNTTTNAIQAINTSNGYNNLITNNILYNFGRINTSQGVLLNNEQNTVVSLNYINNLYWAIRETGTSLHNSIYNNKIDSDIDVKYAIYSSECDNRLNSVETRSTGDYGLTLTSAEYQVYSTDLTAFTTISLPANAHKGMRFVINRNDNGAGNMQIYDSLSSVSLTSTFAKKQSAICICDGTAWHIVSITSLI